MARGGRRVGAGRPRKPVALHALQGTWRRDRHGEYPVEGALAINQTKSKAGPEWVPTRADLSRLGPHGRRLVADWVNAYVLSPVEGQRLFQAALTIDVVEVYRAMPRAGLSPRDLIGLDREIRAGVLLFDRLIGGLGAPRP